MIAKDLYRLRKEVERLEQQLGVARVSERRTIEERLRIAMEEKDRLQSMLEGAKEQPACRRPR
jgi:hypothetical protein